MNRRELLALLGGMLCTSPAFGAQVGGDRPIYGGWYDSPDARRTFARRNALPYFSQHGQAIKGTGQNNRVLLWRVLEAVTGKTFKPHYQQIGDCVSHAFALAVDILTAVQIALYKTPERWAGEAATEIIYGGSRVEVGQGALGRFDGSTGAWAAQWLQDFGVLVRREYGLHYDLSAYRPDLAKSWGRSGVPDELEPLTKQHPVQTVKLITSWEEACDSVSNGYPVVLCSNVGFTRKMNRDGQCVTDEDGFLMRGRQNWNHAMCLAGIDTVSSRPGGAIGQSWGVNWITGPTHKLGTPKGGFWGDAATIDQMLKQGDSYAISNYRGYPKQDIDYRLW